MRCVRYVRFFFFSFLSEIDIELYSILQGVSVYLCRRNRNGNRYPYSAKMKLTLFCYIRITWKSFMRIPFVIRINGNTLITFLVKLFIRISTSSPRVTLNPVYCVFVNCSSSRIFLALYSIASYFWKTLWHVFILLIRMYNTIRYIFSLKI